VCPDCRTRPVLPAVGSGSGELAEELHALVGKSAGAICRTLNLPYEPPYRSVIDAASAIAYDEDRFMSTWSFVTQWLDGSTVWRSQDGEAVAIVSPNGSIRIQPRYSS
jgi:hypothetical protein